MVGRLGVMGSNATFNTISVISWQFYFMEDTAEIHRPVTDKLYHMLLYRVDLT
jgi:hypothetical protein